MQELKEFAERTKKVLSAREMEAIELNSEAQGVSGSQLMENAGVAVAKFIDRQFKGGGSILMVCGLGWKGGSGFAAARQLTRGHKVTVGIVGSKKDVRFGPALENLHQIEHSPFGEIVENVQRDSGCLRGRQLVVDALFGIGFSGRMGKDAASLIRRINGSRTKVVSIDVPSGINPATGRGGVVVNADYTITFYKPKSCIVGLKSAGRIVVEDIGIPAEAEIFAGPGDLMLASRPRKLRSSKRDNGSVMIIAGSGEYHGAPVLTSSAVYSTLAALRTGTGYAYLCVPEAIEDAVRNLSPNTIVRRFGSESIADGDFGFAREQMARSDAVVIGMGIGRSEETLGMAARIIDAAVALKKKVVIDADAIRSLKHGRRLGGNVLLTPQDSEFKELSGGMDLREDGLAERFRKAVGVASKLGANVLLKGHETVVTDGEIAKIVQAESSTLATMGTGDVLSGIIGGYAALGATMFEAGVAGAYLQARIGDLLKIEKGNHILAVDVVDKIPQLIKNFDEDA
jgi:NAD(P)H-hydrate epimerase